MELKVPVDLERLPEFRLLCGEVGAHYARAKRDLSGRAIEQGAMHLWMRLWVELAYMAQTTNRPGVMTAPGVELLKMTLEPLFATEVDPMAVLQRAGCVSQQAEGWYCERFARLNAHLAGNFKSKELRGAAASALERNRKHIAQEALQQSMLLAPEVFRVPDASAATAPGAEQKMRVLTATEVQRCMVLIKTLDNCLKVSGRKKGEYTEGLIADAFKAVEAYKPEELREFYIWLQTERENPLVPKTTEQVLSRMEEVMLMSRA